MPLLTLEVKPRKASQSTAVDTSDDREWRCSSDHFELRLRKREAAPSTYLESNKYGFSTGYKCSDTWREFLKIDYNSNGQLIITRDGLATLPLFYGASDGQLVVSNDYHEVASRLGHLTVDKPTLHEGLMLHDIGQQTLFRQIKILMADQQLVWRDGELSVGSVSRREVVEEPTDPKQFIDYLENTVETYLYEYNLSQLAVEASGGVDSSAVAIIANRLGAEVTTYSAAFSEEFRESQLQKLQSLWSLVDGSGVVTPLDLAESYPLVRYIERNKPAPFYMFEDIYTEILDHIAAAAEDAGVQTMFTGVGGDELFESQSVAEELCEGTDDKQRRLSRRISDFYTDKFRVELERSIQQLPDRTVSPLTRTARSVLFAHVSTNNIFIERGIWPVAPLADYQLFAYTQALPVVHKANKNILRIYLESIKVPELLYNPAQNEHFGPILEQAIAGPLKPALLETANNSKLVESELVDRHQLLCGINDEQSLQRDAIKYFVWLTTELNLAADGQLKAEAQYRV